MKYTKLFEVERNKVLSDLIESLSTIDFKSGVKIKIDPSLKDIKLSNNQAKVWRITKNTK